MKKYLIYAGMFLGSFLVVNVAMYFVLSMTHPKPSQEMSEAVDSTAVISDTSMVALHDSTVHGEIDSLETIPAHGDSLQQQTDAVETPPEFAEIPAPDSTYEVENQAAESTSLQQPVEDNTAALLTDNTAEAQQTALQPEITEPSLAPDPKELAKLAKLLEGMKPAEAAAIASRLSTDEIVALVMKMKDRKAAKMMAELPVSTAALVAQRMSELVGQPGDKL